MLQSSSGYGLWTELLVLQKGAGNQILDEDNVCLESFLQPGR